MSIVLPGENRIMNLYVPALGTVISVSLLYPRHRFLPVLSSISTYVAYESIWHCGARYVPASSSRVVSMLNACEHVPVSLYSPFPSGVSVMPKRVCAWCSGQRFASS